MTRLNLILNLICLKSLWFMQAQGQTFNQSCLIFSFMTRLTPEPGTFESPGYPLYYPNDETCTYIITAPLMNKVVITRIDRFDTESNYDMVTFYDGPSPYFNKIARLSGNLSTFQEIASSGRTLLVKFTSDETFMGRGFKFYYTFRQTLNSFSTTSGNIFSNIILNNFTSSYYGSNITFNNSTSNFFVNNVTSNNFDNSCTLFRASSVGYFQSPNYPNNYPDNSRCFLTINAPVGKIVRIDLSGDFNTEQMFDPLTIYDGLAEPNNTRLFRYSGVIRSIESIYSTKQTVQITFSSDYSINAKGFRFNFFFIEANRLTNNQSRIL